MTALLGELQLRLVWGFHFGSEASTRTTMQRRRLRLGFPGLEASGSTKMNFHLFLQLFLFSGPGWLGSPKVEL
ncbi:hypothetical protein ACLOJK_013389 [Asimina triloba]